MLSKVLYYRRDEISLSVNKTLRVSRRRGSGLRLASRQLAIHERSATIAENRVLIDHQRVLTVKTTRKKVGDFGVDGWMLNGRPIQVKQSEDVGRNVIDNFETAMRRQGRTKGIIIAFSFGKGAWEEVARAKQEGGLEIELKTIEELLKET